MTSRYKGPTRRLGRPTRASTTQQDVALLVDADSVYEQACGNMAKSKNNSSVRRNMGYEHIPKKLAQPIHDFYQATFNPWINHHRPCLYANEVTDRKEKIRKRYAHKDTQTPLEKLVSLMAQNKAELKPDITLKALLDEAMAETDMQAARRMRKEKQALWDKIIAYKKAHKPMPPNDQTQRQSA